MMKYTNIRQLGCLFCFAILLAGCSDSVMSIDGGTNRYIVVEGVTYDFGCYYWLQNSKLTHSHIVVFPFGHQHYFPAVRHPKGQAKGEIYYQDLTTAVAKIVDQHIYNDRQAVEGEKIADVAFGYVYFIDNKRIIFQKSYAELGIDVVNPKSAFDKENLFPILEKMIRENVPPQEDIMEEQQ